MKTKIDRMKHSQRITKRTLALALCFVMLFSALGATSVMSAIAQGIAPSADAQPTDDADAAVADASVPAEGDSSDSPGAGENGFFKAVTDQINEISENRSFASASVDEGTDVDANGKDGVIASDNDSSVSPGAGENSSFKSMTDQGDGISENQSVASDSVDEDTDEEEGVLAPKGDSDLADTGYSGKVALAGDFNSWSTTAKTDTLYNNSAYFSSVNLTAGSHEFKLYIYENGEWWGCSASGTMNATVGSSWTLNSSASNAYNVGLNVTTAGNYAFRATYS